MPAITLSLTKDELELAVRDWVEKKGFDTTDRFSVTVKTTEGDRPFEPSYTTTTVTGVWMKEPSK